MILKFELFTLHQAACPLPSPACVTSPDTITWHKCNWNDIFWVTMHNERKNSANSMYSFQLRLRHRNPGSGRAMFSGGGKLLSSFTYHHVQLAFAQTGCRGSFPPRVTYPPFPWAPPVFWASSCHSTSNTFSKTLPLDRQLPHNGSLFCFRCFCISHFLPSSGHAVSVEKVFVDWLKEKASV